ncbi:MAG: glutamate ligase domain-containing protein, partial [Bacteroidota bacterium]
ERNIPGVLRCIDELVHLGFVIDRESIESGFRKVTDQTGLKGRWQKIGSNPTVYCDTGHNEAGVKEVVAMIRRQTFHTLLMVIGMVKDKDISKVLSLLPKEGYYFFCQAKIPRAMDAVGLQKQAGAHGLHGEVIPDVNEALAHARAKAQAGDFIFVGGSTFVVAELNDI